MILQTFTEETLPSLNEWVTLHKPFRRDPAMTESVGDFTQTGRDPAMTEIKLVILHKPYRRDPAMIE